jgi:hypothetical protein
VPSQSAAARLSLATLHLAALHTVLVPAKAQVAVWTPSQSPPQVVPLLRQLCRLPIGCPFVGVQVPALGARLQLAHWSVQAVSQQTPSTQKPEPHWSVLVQALPSSCLGTQRRAALQKSPVTQFASLLQDVGQPALAPSQVYVPQLLAGPAAPAGSTVQVPSLLAPSEAEHTSQPPPQGLSQQTPSTQLPDWQSCDVEQAWPFGTLGWQLLLTHVLPAEHCDSRVQLAGQVVVAPSQT